MRSALILILAIIGVPLLAQAQSLVINDCYGFTRSVKGVNQGELSKVEVRVESATGATSGGANVTLTNVVSGEIMSSVVESGLVVFDNVPAGVFELATLQEGLQIGALWISPMGAAPLVAGAALLGAGAVGAGGVVAAVEVVNNATDDGGDSPTPIPTPQPTAQPTPQPTQTPIVCEVCDAEATPRPIDEFARYQPLSPHS